MNRYLTVGGKGPRPNSPYQCFGTCIYICVYDCMLYNLFLYLSVIYWFIAYLSIHPSFLKFPCLHKHPTIPCPHFALPPRKTATKKHSVVQAKTVRPVRSLLIAGFLQYMHGKNRVPVQRLLAPIRLYWRSVSFQGDFGNLPLTLMKLNIPTSLATFFPSFPPTPPCAIRTSWWTHGASWKKRWWKPRARTS